MLLVDDACRRFAMRRFLEHCKSNEGECLFIEGPYSREYRLFLLQERYVEWLDDWIDGLDEPSVVMALYLKYLRSYRRCVRGPKKGNTWNMEFEGWLWTGAYALTGKNNYVTENCYRGDTLYTKMTPSELEWHRRNHTFVMYDDGPGNSLDEMNERVNDWNKGIWTSSNFAKVCEYTRYVMITRACAFESFGQSPSRKRTVKPSHERDVILLLEIFEKGDIFPLQCTKKRVYHKDFWWNIVKPRANTGPQKDKQKETVIESSGVEFVMDILGNNTDDRDFDEFDDASEQTCSIQSSTMGSHCSELVDTGSIDGEMDTDNMEQDWEQLNEKEREEELGKNMKKIKMKKKDMSPYIMKDMLGSDGDACIVNLKKSHTKTLRAHELRINEVYRAVRYFNVKFEKRMQRLQVSLQRSQSNTYSTTRYKWREDYDKLMAELYG